MARQRRHVSRRGRRGRFRGLYRVLSVLAVAVALVVACVVFFRVNEVTVSGNQRYTAQQIVEASGIKLGDNLITLSKSRVAGNLIAKLPYVRSITIDRKLPDGLLITVEEHVAAAAVSDGESWWYVAAQGKLLERVDDPGTVMRVTGLTAADPMVSDDIQVEQDEENTLSYVLALLTELEARGMLGQCTALDCTAAASITLDYDIYHVKLPRRSDYSQYLALFQGALTSDRMPQGVPGTFDLTIQDGRAYFQPEDEEPIASQPQPDPEPDPSASQAAQ